MRLAGGESAGVGGVVASVPSQPTLPALQTWGSHSQSERLGSARSCLLVILPVRQDKARKRRQSLIFSILVLAGVDCLQLTLVGGVT